ncbi:MAG: FAD-dependent thymidylate synthase [Holosporaceae bacterium]|jgi:thymidylate synthase (FAD)|nr:FAD-dependent thymidylate synthase [Holosporaceae bacterium]
MSLEELSDVSIDDLRNKCRNETARGSSRELEDILYKPIKVLDHGFIRVVDYMGTDASIVQAARVSYGRGTKKTQEDQGLINYLMRHGHTTPFEMCELKLHVKLPIFVMRQWIRHRTASTNEYSSRYSVLHNEFYLPEVDQIARQSTFRRQGKSEVPLDSARALEILEILKCANGDAYEKYSRLLDDFSLTRELARTVLPVSIYTEMYWKIDLHNLLHFLKLRTDFHSQYEIRCYADVILGIVKRWTPCAYEAFVNYRQESVSVAGKCVDIVNRALKGESVCRENSGLSDGEWRDLTETFHLE